MTQGIIHDIAYLENWFYENEICYIVPYIEENFAQESWEYQYQFMSQHLYFSKKIIEDSLMSNGEKVLKLLKLFSYGKSKIMTIVGGRGSGKLLLLCILLSNYINRVIIEMSIMLRKETETPSSTSAFSSKSRTADISKDEVKIR